MHIIQSADARRALPCWDEPAFKATFDVVLTVPKDRVALSNMVRQQFRIHLSIGVILYLVPLYKFLVGTRLFPLHAVITVITHYNISSISRISIIWYKYVK